MTTRTSRLKRLAWRIPFRVARSVLVAIGYIHIRPYMAGYLPLLAAFGMKFTGKPRYIAQDAYFDDISQISLGNRVVISTGVRFLTHDYSLTTALIAIGEPLTSDVARVAGVTVGDNVFIGLRSIILPNARIGSNIIIGAGSVVRGTVPDNSVYVGNPGKVVGSLTDYAMKCRDIVDSGLVRQD